MPIIIYLFGGDNINQTRSLYLKSRSVYTEDCVKTFLDICAVHVAEFFPGANTGTVNNARGACFEMFFEEIVNRLIRTLHLKLTLKKLPNSSKDVIFNLLSDEVAQNYKKVISELSLENLSLYFSNPDYMLYSGDLDNPHPSNVVCLFSIKSSLRSDRRYQLLHEANTIKWICSQIDISPLAFNIVSCNINRIDYEVFDFVHTGNGASIRAVDNVIDFHSGNYFDDIIKVIVK